MRVRVVPNKNNEFAHDDVKWLSAKCHAFLTRQHNFHLCDCWEAKMFVINFTVSKNTRANYIITGLKKLGHLMARLITCIAYLLLFIRSSCLFVSFHFIVNNGSHNWKKYSEYSFFHTRCELKTNHSHGKFPF